MEDNLEIMESYTFLKSLEGGTLHDGGCISAIGPMLICINHHIIRMTSSF